MKGQLINSYVDDIKNNIENGKVLDVGCCATNTKNLMKRHIEYAKVADRIIGIDYNREFLDKGRTEMGIKNLYYCDITNNNDVSGVLQRFGQFDHIICTDLIEHIGNLTLFLDNIYRLMSIKSKLYITTPNARSIRWVLRSYKSDDFSINRDHVCWFDQTTLETLLNRSNMSISKIMYCINKNEKKRARQIGLNFKPCLAGRLYVIAEKIGRI